MPGFFVRPCEICLSQSTVKSVSLAILRRDNLRGRFFNNCFVSSRTLLFNLLLFRIKALLKSNRVPSLKAIILFRKGKICLTDGYKCVFLHFVHAVDFETSIKRKRK